MRHLRTSLLLSKLAASYKAASAPLTKQSAELYTPPPPVGEDTRFADAVREKLGPAGESAPADKPFWSTSVAGEDGWRGLMTPRNMAIGGGAAALPLLVYLLRKNRGNA